MRFSVIYLLPKKSSKLVIKAKNHFCINGLRDFKFEIEASVSPSDEQKSNLVGMRFFWIHAVSYNQWLVIGEKYNIG